MTDVSITEDRGSSLLDAFARSEPREQQNVANLPVATSPLPERVVGAQKVAVYRDEQRVLEKIKVLASAAGSDWYYRFPVKTKGGGQDWIEGASIKLANDLARLWGNCEVDTRVTDLGDSWLIYARFFDLESGFTMTRPFQQRKGQRGMRGEGDRMLDINLQIGASKAIRNVIVNSLQSIADFALDEARNALVDKIGKNLNAYRARTLEGLGNKDIELPRVERVIGRAAKDWTAPDIARVIAMMRSISDGMTTVDETFPPLTASGTDTGPLATSSGPGGGGAQDARNATTADDQSAARTSSASPEQSVPAAADESVARAFERGKQAKAAGHKRSAIPGEYRDAAREAEAAAWADGWDGKPNPLTGELL
jgi:hypothetical protein